MTDRKRRPYRATKDFTAYKIQSQNDFAEDPVKVRKGYPLWALEDPQVLDAQEVAHFIIGSNTRVGSIRPGTDFASQHRRLKSSTEP